MRNRLIGSFAIVTLTLAACGGGDGSSGDQGKAADLLLEAAAEDDIELDEECVRETAGKLSDEDAAKIVEAGADSDADISEEAEQLATEIFDCVDTDALVDQLVEELGDTEGLDTDCLKDILRDVDPDELAGGQMPDGLFDCIDIGG